MTKSAKLGRGMAKIGKKFWLILVHRTVLKGDRNISVTAESPPQNF